jgi:GH15 family glucan-1,4-alpha-glucosidase
MMVGLDEDGLVHDFYYPYVGLDNLTSARSTQHLIGVWVDGQFSWTNSGGWEITTAFEDGGLISNITMRSDSLNVTLKLSDFVDTEYNAFVRHVEVCNDADNEREIRLFMHQVFQISRAGRADTAMYVPDDHYILDYKGRCSLLIAGKLTDGGDFDQYAVGNYGIEGKSGTFRDAEDGNLSNNAVEHGGVDSVLRFSKSVGAKSSYGVDYWVAAADSQTDAQVIHTYLKYYPVADRLQATREHWQKWLEPSQAAFSKLSDNGRRMAERSALIIKAHCDDRGSVLASGDSSIFNYGRDYYCYCWPRDAALAVWPLIRLGQYTEAKRFFEFARDTMHRDGYLAHKFEPDRSLGSTWHPLVHGNSRELAIQEDETASVVYMMGEYYRASRDLAFIEAYFSTFIEPCADFMAGFIDDATGLPHASYDLWEERFATHTYTVCIVLAALETARELAEITRRPQQALRWRNAIERINQNLPKLYHPDGYFRKSLLLLPDGNIQYDDTLDISSFFGAYMFARLPMGNEMLTSTAKHVEQRLLNTTPIGGVIRYEGDNYFLTKHQYKGNPWIICSLWMAQYYHAAKQPEQAQELVDWALARAVPSGALNEQFDPETGADVSVSPLVWSHAEVINTLLDIGGVK